MDNSKKLQTFNLAEKTEKVKLLTAQTAENIIKIGKTLIEVKENLPYGEFEKWLETDINYSKRMAYNFMKVSKEFPDVQPVAELGIRKLLALAGLETEEREKVIANNDLKSMTVNEVEKVVDEEKMVKKVNDFMERLSKPIEVSKSNLEYIGENFTDNQKDKLDLLKIFDKGRCHYYQFLLDIKEIFQDNILFAKFTIQTGLKESIEEFAFKFKTPYYLRFVLHKLLNLIELQTKGDEQ